MFDKPVTELDQLTGVAAILRFPMPELEDSDAEDESDTESDWYLPTK